MKVMKIENAHIIWPNFAGVEKPPYNPEGRRNFCVRLPMELAEQMKDDGWSVNIKEPDDPDDDPYAILRVAVNYKNADPSMHPKIRMHTDDGETTLDSESVGVLDQAIIDHATIKVSPWAWEFGGRTGVKAFLKSADVYIKNVSDRE